jgi:hypothetical protein
MRASFAILGASATQENFRCPRLRATAPKRLQWNCIERIALADNWTQYSGALPLSLGLPWKKTMNEILDAYSECLNAVKGGRARGTLRRQSQHNRP